METRKLRIVSLWIVMTTGLLTHTLMDLLPLFWGNSVATSQGEVPLSIAFLMGGFTYTLPFVGLLLWLYGQNKRSLCIASLIVAIVIMLFQIFHMSELIMGSAAVQFIIMPLNAIAAILLVVELWKEQRALKSKVG